MKYKIIKNFLNNKQTEELIKDAEINSDTLKYQKIHNNRLFLTCSNSEFHNLCKKSIVWNELEKKFASEDFFKFCCDSLNIDYKNFIIQNHFKNSKNNKLDKIMKYLSSKQLKILNASTIIKFLIVRLFNRTLRKIKFSKLFFPFKKPVELLYDYSVAGNGYMREIHRDSDNRIIVFLLYLNSLESGAKGGNLEIFKLKNNIKLSTAKPLKEECDIIETLNPEAGKLVIFQNGDDSFHSVSKIENAEKKRHFIYGGFTLLSDKNPYITNKSILKTEFHLYE